MENNRKDFRWRNSRGDLISQFWMNLKAKLIKFREKDFYRTGSISFLCLTKDRNEGGFSLQKKLLIK